MNHQEWINNYMAEHEKRDKVASSKEYALWINTFMTRMNIVHFSDDSWLYHQKDLSEEDYFNTSILSYFYDNISRLAVVQKVKPKQNEYDDSGIYYINICDAYFTIACFHGQGTLTFIDKLSKKPRRKCVVIT